MYEKCVSARGCTLDNQGNFGFQLCTLTAGRARSYPRNPPPPPVLARVSVLVCDSVACELFIARWASNTNFTAAHSLDVRRGFFAFDSLRSSRICECVCTGSIHQRIRAMAFFLDYLNI